MAKGMPWSSYAQEEDQVPNVHETGWVSGPVWMGPENLAPLQPVEDKGAFLQDSSMQTENKRQSQDKDLVQHKTCKEEKLGKITSLSIQRYVYSPDKLSYLTILTSRVQKWFFPLVRGFPFFISPFWFVLYNILSEVRRIAFLAYDGTNCNNQLLHLIYIVDSS